ncbi:MAG TPA: aminotransferase class III-fold pyridoxal phosphate-dependent enzyme, partial [Myxococcota bacterium]|nr:aminotransferase class III-fold pyridoxal phosphate-dependent enzyme [Myxococcota bacterium]
MKTALPGPKSRALVEEEKPYLAPGTQGIWKLAGIAADSGEGALLRDVDGNQYIDMVAGICVGSLGYGHKRQAQVIAEQASKLMVGSYTTAPRVSLLKRIAKLTPKAFGLVRTQLYSGGAEAVESALRLARAFTGKFEVMSFWGGFHGKTQGVLGLMGSDFKHGLGPQQPGLYQVPYADCYRCPFKLKPDSCGLACVEFMREALKKQTTGSLAAVIAEPIQGTNGNVIPPDDFLPAVRSVAEEMGALFISDEMITGFGRSGKMFGCEHSGVQPDIMTIGKALGGGYPITGLITTDEICGAEPWSKPSFSSSSYGGNPLGAAAADVAISTVVDEDLVGNSQRIGAEILQALQPLVEKYPFVGEVRGRGLMIGLELVRDKKTKEPLGKKACEAIFL